MTSVSSLEEIEMQQPFTERVLLPLLQRVGELSTSVHATEGP